VDVIELGLITAVSKCVGVIEIGACDCCLCVGVIEIGAYG